MDREQFKEKLKPLGYLRRKWRGETPEDEDAWEEQVLELYPRPVTCPKCTEVEFIKKRGVWFKKCSICREKTQVSNVVNK
jgi:hypothetical protein